MGIPRCLVRALAIVAMVPGGAVVAASTTDFSDQWWVERESGWGASVQQQADVLFVTLFVYGTDGKPTWLSAAAFPRGDSSEGRRAFTGDLYRTTGSCFAVPWDPSLLAYRKVGTLTFAETGADQASLTYSVDGVAVAKSVTRALWRYENLSGSYHGGLVHDQIACTRPSDNGHYEAAATLDIRHTADNAVTMRILVPSTGEDLLLAGTYSQSGHMGRIEAAMSAASATLSIDVFEIERSPCGFTARFVGTRQSAGGSCRITNGRIAGVQR